jgi:hypothetical protein
VCSYLLDTTLVFMDDLKRIPVRVKYIGGPKLPQLVRNSETFRIRLQAK